MEDPEENLRRFMEQETLRNEQRRLRRQLDQLEKSQFISTGLALLWVTVMFLGFQGGVVSAALAGLITLWSFVGAGYILWRIHIRKREISLRLAKIEPPEEGAKQPS